MPRHDHRSADDNAARTASFAAHPRLSVALLLGCLALCLGGCASYQLQGKVIEGRVAGVAVVDKNDPRLKQDGVPGVAVSVTVDPRSMSPKRIPPTQSEYDGTFRVPVGELGAGVLEYEMDIAAQATGYAPVADRMALPGSGRRVLIILAPGQGAPPRKNEDILRETLRIGEPFMD